MMSPSPVTSSSWWLDVPRLRLAEILPRTPMLVKAEKLEAPSLIDPRILLLSTSKQHVESKLIDYRRSLIIDVMERHIRSLALTYVRQQRQISSCIINSKLHSCQ